ncbi:MAG TPA: HAD-IC family P-type ATPase, partial [Clostridiales bacterium]|nr:HAD-IC family P-type ATPase [Clostridiales bacterium]
MEWYKASIESTASQLSVDLNKGLASEEAEKRLEQHGRNELQEKEKESLLAKIINQLKDFLVLILIGASIVSAFVGEVTDSIVIIAIVVINAILGIVQEGKAEKALEALKKMSSPTARVIRDGHVTTVPASVLVPGDIILLEAGDIIPADVRLIESYNLKIEEASLTGESVPVEKNAYICFDEDVSIGDRKNMGYMSTTVTYGRGRGIVIGTGSNTEIGKIAIAIEEIKDESTPLQQKLDQLGKWLGSACLFICLLVFIIGVMRGQNILEMFMVAISLAVAAIPEGL